MTMTTHNLVITQLSPLDTDMARLVKGIMTSLSHREAHYLVLILNTEMMGSTMHNFLITPLNTEIARLWKGIAMSLCHKKD